MKIDTDKRHFHLLFRANGDIPRMVRTTHSFRRARTWINSNKRTEVKSHGTALVVEINGDVPQEWTK